MHKCMKKSMHKCMRKWQSSFFAVTLFLFLSCISVKSEFSKIPCQISGEFSAGTYNKNIMVVHSEDSDLNFYDEPLLLEFSFTNLSEKIVQSFTIVFFAVDEDGYSLFYERNNLVLKIEKNVYPEETYSGCIDISNFLASIPKEVPELEYIYVSRLEFSDGSVFEL